SGSAPAPWHTTAAPRRTAPGSPAGPAAPGPPGRAPGRCRTTSGTSTTATARRSPSPSWPSRGGRRSRRAGPGTGTSPRPGARPARRSAPPPAPAAPGAAPPGTRPRPPAARQQRTPSPAYLNRTYIPHYRRGLTFRRARTPTATPETFPVSHFTQPFGCYIVATVRLLSVGGGRHGISRLVGRRLSIRAEPVRRTCDGSQNP